MTARADVLPTGWGVYALTTEDRPERSAHLRAEMERAGMPAHIHLGRRPTDAGGFRGIGSRGCVESHLACLRAAYEQGVDVCIIAEDDVVLARRTPSLLRAIAGELRDVPWSVLYIGHLPASPSRSQPVTAVTPHVVRADGWEIHGAHFVAIRREVLAALIDNFEQRFLPGGHRIDADGILNEFRRDHALATYLCLPNLAIQAPSPSGLTASSSWRNRMLEHAWIRRAVEVPKRAALSLSAYMPTSLLVWRWNRRARATRAGSANG